MKKSIEKVVGRQYAVGSRRSPWAVGGMRWAGRVLLPFAFCPLPFALCLLPFAFCLLPFAVLTAQQPASLTPEPDARHALMMTGRSTGNSIKLRWAPTSALAWKRCNEAGYVVVRHTIMRNGQMLPWEERSVMLQLTPDPIRPWQTEAEWRPLMERNEYAAIGAQSLLGEQFTIESGPESSATLVNRASEESNRFSFGLFAADHSYETAVAMGLAWEDKNVKQHETYVYRVYPATQISVPMDTFQVEGNRDIPVDFRSPIDTGFFSISPKDKFPLPKILEVEADFGNRVATISWNKTLFEQFYVSYRVERSDDGLLWESLRDKPFVTLARPGSSSEFMFMLDSLPMNNKPYFYRVSGRTVFDDFGAPSDPVQGMGIDPLPEYFPYIVSVLENERQEFVIGWDFNAAEESKIAGFRITRARSDRGAFVPVSGEGLLPPSQRSFTDEAPLPVNYYKVIAYDAYNREMPSFSALAQIDDETPPAAPLNVRGAVLKNGSMVISWDANTEPDLLGYRVYMANHPNDEFTQITRAPVSANHFIDTVGLNTLSREIFVQVIALDYRHNSSPFSKMAVVLRPDTIAPAAPAFREVVAETSGVRLQWANSQSKDVMYHELLRRPKNSTAGWMKIAEFPFRWGEKFGQFVDSTGIVGEDVVYQLAAVDNSDLRGLSQTVEARRLDNFIRPQVSNVEVIADRRNKHIELRWHYVEMEPVRLFELYRSESNGKLNRYRAYTPDELSAVESAVVSGKKNTRKGFAFIAQDKDLRMNTEYTYAVRAIYHDGGLSPLSEPVRVRY
ncbi:MAG: fibronectin type III domain-containing protein [Saprospiraceae bacterium]|nr:fibronectin type III domain-containing protein [Saprospiraceae bacterium]